MSQDVMICVMISTAVFDDVNVEMHSSEFCVKCLDLDAELLNKQNAYYDLLKSYSQLKKHCISLELTMQLNQEIFQKDSFSDNQNDLKIPKYFENNDLKGQLQAKDTTTCKLKEHIKSMRENDKEEKVKHDMDEIETIFIELEHSVAKLLYENKHLHKEIEHLKNIYKDQFDSIKKTRALSKEHGKNVLDNAATITNATTIAPGMFKLDLDPLAPRIQELLVYARDTCPNAYKPSEKLVESSKAPDSNTPVLPSTGLKSSTSASRSQPTRNKKNDRILQTPSSNMNNQVEVQRNRSQLMKFVSKFLGTVRFRNDQIALSSWGYGDYQLGNLLFEKNTCFIRNLEGVDLLLGSKDINLYTISLDDMLKTSPICLLSKASKTKSWLWHRRLSHLNFGTLNKLAKDSLARGIPKLKFKKDHICSACALGKSKKSSHQPKAKDTNQYKLYLLHMDLCGLMHMESINGKKYILVIFDDYSRFTWVKFLRSKDEAPNTIIKCIKNIQVCLNATVLNVRTDNGTEFVNQTLQEFYEIELL
ncbi:retrovirus-related pol polyprotein from transposon TNT 1-94 [Tanacetum coccineum]